MSAIVDRNGERLARRDVHQFHPSDLTLIYDDRHPLYDQSIHDPLDPEFVADIEARGIDTPVIVRRNGPHFEVVVGRSRVRAALEILNRTGKVVRVPGAVRTFTSDLELVKTMTAENCRRKVPDAIQRAFYAARLRQFGASEIEIAEDLQVSKETVRRDVVLLDLAPEVQNAIKAKDIPVTAAPDLATLPREKQVETVNRLKAESDGKIDKTAVKRAVTPVDKATRLTSHEVIRAMQSPAVRALTTPRERAIAAWARSGDLAELLDYPDLTDAIRKGLTAPRPAAGETEDAA